MKRLILSCLLLSTPTLAQPAPQETPDWAKLALQRELSECVFSKVGVRSQAGKEIDDLQKHIAALQGEIEKLKASPTIETK